MKKSLFVRMMSALGSLVLWALGVMALAETFFHVPVTSLIGSVLGARTPVMVLVTLVAAIVLFALGLCGFLMLSTKRAVKRTGFVMQKGEDGMIGVSVKSIEGLVQTCVKQHEVVERAEISVVERRDGIVILLNVQEAAGVSIPLAIGALQKQVKQYVSSCTGVDVHEVRVLVENTENDAVESPYVVEKPVVLTTAATAAAMRQEEPSVTEAAEEVPVVDSLPDEGAPAEEEILEDEDIIAEEVPVQEESPVQEEMISAVEETPVAEIPMTPAVPVMPVIPPLPEFPVEEDDRPLHQRLFGAEEQPVFVPMPPQMVIEPQAEIVEAPMAEVMEKDGEEPAEEAETIDEIAPNAVLEVVEAIAQEESVPQDEHLADDESSEYDEEVLMEEALLDGADEDEIPETEI